MKIQFWLGRISVVMLALLSLIAIRLLGYRVRGLRELRQKCWGQFRRHRGPWLICANHLTMIDSVILIYAMLPSYRYMLEFELVPWNLPERDNFQRNPLVALLCYLTKCIPVNRGGDRDRMKVALDKCEYVLEKGESLMIFPEGGRSRTGYVNTEDFSYGVGRFVKDFPSCKVLCLYLRGDGQKNFSSIPRWNENFTVCMDVYEPAPLPYNGLRAQREYAEQIIHRLARLEENYFASRGQRYRGPGRSGERAKDSRPALH